MATHFWASMEKLTAQRMRPKSPPYDNSPVYRYLPRRTPTWAFPVPCSHPRDPILVHPPLFWWGNTNPMFARSNDAPVVVHRHSIPMPRLPPRVLPCGSATMTTTSLPPFSASGNLVVRSVSSSDLLVAVDRVSAPSHPFSQCAVILYDLATSPN
ncbi:uncharacterized protein ARMOST_01436 [Armillaria ostoyae]|uniref:Uncharacterized protein n=1 Tax=Armillaria ostoyae TaxID=47428 RepID=A0A284QNW8_ARMOS|nr:uncharacterized protein ARMOST_01436 [Armillaria ostoyae]